jgi:adenylate kinase
VRLVVLGPQGAGKGTQSALIAEKFGIPSISTGEIFRWAIAGGTALGRKVQGYVDEGSLVPDELTIEVVRERVSAADTADGWILDGFPRNLTQAKALGEMLSDWQQNLDAALLIDIPEEIILSRILGRRVCSVCGRNYHVNAPPQKDWICDTCGGKVVARVDDNEESIHRRLQLYFEMTEPVTDYYESKGLLRVIDGDGTPGEVFNRILAVL